MVLISTIKSSSQLYGAVSIQWVPLWGRATFGEYFFFYQGCTVGGDHNTYPVIGHHVRLFANSTVLGESHIGNNVWIGAGALVKNTDIPDNSLVFGQSPNLIIKQRKDI